MKTITASAARKLGKFLSKDFRDIFGSRHDELAERLGSLARVKRLVKTLGMVNATPDFKDQPQVINGFSELMAEVFGEDAGVGARSAVGMGSLPGNIPVEVECIFEVI